MSGFRAGLGSEDVLLLTLDALRYDVAQEAWRDGATPNFARLLPSTGWEARHTPGSFTFPAHQSFFAGFLPTPVGPGPHPRPWAVRFAGSKSTGPDTLVFEAPHVIAGYAAAGYHTLCVGSTGFFNPGAPLGRVLPGHFAEAHWEPSFGVSDPRSAENQFRWVAARLEALPAGQRVFLFVNVGATHPPTRVYLPGARSESRQSQMAALRYADGHLPALLEALRARGRWRGILCADHGTCHGEDGYEGHRVAHPLVWTVPYAEVEIAP
jgi:hypothetical protein